MPFPNSTTTILRLAVLAFLPAACGGPALTAEAERACQRGLDLYFGFHYERSIAAFEEAARLAPASWRPQWGIALALGPNLNSPDMGLRLPRAREAAQRAVALSERESPRDRDAARVLAARYDGDATLDADRRNRQYVEAMNGLFRAYPADADIAVLYAESIVVADRGGVWGPDGTATPGTARAVAALEDVLRRQPAHVGANHLYVHLIENSPSPQRALASAERLETLVPDAGHLLHMPSHIYLRLGDYRRAVAVNQRAIAADTQHPAHDHHGTDAGLQGHTSEFLSAAAGFTGQSAVARAANDNAFVLMRFGLWNEILSRPVPDRGIGRLEMRIARVLALTATKRLADAEAELRAYEEAERAMPGDATWWADSLERFTAMARAEMAAGLAWARGDRPRAIAHWREAVAAQDRLTRDESVLPWFHPLRESLGAALYQAGMFAEAEQTFRADLAINPHNPRSLFGLWQTLAALKRTDEAAAIKKAFEDGWRDADIQLAITDL